MTNAAALTKKEKVRIIPDLQIAKAKTEVKV